MGINHINTITDKEVEQAGVSKRDFDKIKKLMRLDSEIFLDKDVHWKTKSESPFVHSVDLSKYDSKKIPTDCKEILYRPEKMKKLYN